MVVCTGAMVTGLRSECKNQTSKSNVNFDDLKSEKKFDVLHSGLNKQNLTIYREL